MSIAAMIGGSLMSRGLDIFGNLVNGEINQMYNDAYMSKWGSIGALIDQMKKAGMNPYAIAQQNLNPSNLSGNSVSMAAPLGILPEMLNSTLNPTIKANVDSLTAANNANARANNVNATFLELTLDERINQLKTDGKLKGNALKLSDIYTGRYQEIVDLNIKLVDEAIKKTLEEVKKIEKERDLILKLVDKINEEIKLIKTQEDLNKALLRKAESETLLNQYELRIKAVQANNMELFNIVGGTASEAYYIAGLNGDTETQDGIRELQGELSKENTSAVQSGLNQSNPTLIQEAELLEQRNKRLSDIDKEISDLLKEMKAHPYRPSSRLKFLEILKLKADKTFIELRYARRLRRIRRGSSTGVSIAGTGVNVSN